MSNLAFQTVILNRRGRKRKSGHRKPSGDLIQKQEDARIIVLRQPHRRGGETLADQIDARRENAFGMLCVRKLISVEQYEAGKRYANDVRRYLILIEAPAGTPRSANLVMGRGAGGETIWLDADDAERRRVNYNSAFEALAPAGQRACRAISRMAVYNETMPGNATLDLVLSGLNLLVSHYGLTTNANHARGGK